MRGPRSPPSPAKAAAGCDSGGGAASAWTPARHGQDDGERPRHQRPSETGRHHLVLTGTLPSFSVGVRANVRGALPVCCAHAGRKRRTSRWWALASADRYRYGLW